MECNRENYIHNKHIQNLKASMINSDAKTTSEDQQRNNLLRPVGRRRTATDQKRASPTRRRRPSAHQTVQWQTRPSSSSSHHGQRSRGQPQQQLLCLPSCTGRWKAPKRPLLCCKGTTPWCWAMEQGRICGAQQWRREDGRTKALPLVGQWVVNSLSMCLVGSTFMCASYIISIDV